MAEQRERDPGCAADARKVPSMPARRVVLQAGGTALMSALLVPLAGCGSSSPRATDVDDVELRGPDRPTPRAHFLSDAERAALAALVDRLIPAGLQPGAAAAGCEEAIDALLAAFLTDPPLIYAGGPFSDRSDGARNDFERFIPLDGYEELAWRIVIEGSQGRPEREFNGPVRGLQEIYREGLARLDQRAAQLATGVLPSGIGGLLRDFLDDTPLSTVLELLNRLTGTEVFADLPPLLRDLIVVDPTDETVQTLVDVAFPNTLDGMYGPPEYGGNRDLVGWTSTGSDGDVQPRGYTDSEVIHRDVPGVFDAFLPPSFGGTDTGGPSALDVGSKLDAPLPPLLIAAGESLAAAIMGAEGSLAGLRSRLAPMAALRPEWTWRDDNA
jgi:hypothetical protein